MQILIVDDDALLRNSLARALGASHEVVSAASPDEAIARMSEGGIEVALVDLDLGDETSGIALLETIEGRWPTTKRVLMTGHTVDAASASSNAVEDILLKPVSMHDIRLALDRLGS